MVELSCYVAGYLDNSIKRYQQSSLTLERFNFVPI